MTYTLALLPVLLLFMGMPIFLVLLSASAVTVLFVMSVPLAALHQTLFGAVDSFALLSVPFFIFAGELMGRGSVAKRIVDILQSGIGTVPCQPLMARKLMEGGLDEPTIAIGVSLRRSL
jgi:C4-dicarboxylate transporter DctM subunit